MKIEIEIENLSLFTQVARVIDKPKIRKGIAKLRNKWTGGKLYPDLESWRKTRNSFNFRKELTELLLDNEISPIFLPVLEEAVVTGKVTKFTRVVRLPIPRKELTEYYALIGETLQDEDYEYVLVTPLDASRDEVATAFGEMKNVVKDTLKQNDPENMTGYYELKPPNPDTKSEIKQHRDWYWMNLSKSKGGMGMSYDKIGFNIAQIEGSNDTIAKRESLVHKDKIRQAIKDYKALLK